MENFFKLLFASCLGTLIALGFLIFIGFTSITAISSAFSTKDVSVSANSILKIAPTQIPELTNNIPSGGTIELEREDKIGLRDYKRLINLAKNDSDIKGIYLDLSNTSASPATKAAFRKALNDFKSDGKFIYTYSTIFSQTNYGVASVADKIFLNPNGLVEIRGFGSMPVYFKETLESIGVDAKVFYAGDFKSAGEPFFRTNMSDSARHQSKVYLNELWNIWLDDVSKGRNIDKATLNAMATNFSVQSAQDALDKGIVDALYYKDQVLTDIKKQLGLEKEDKINVVTDTKYFKKLKSKNLRSNKHIAVIYAEGNIVDGQGDVGSIGGEKYTNLIRKVRSNEKTKAIVLRINSPGGSALASDNMWRELQLAREDGIPVIASMGGYAASGGYYIACAADSIIADPSTITGSIGVFAIVPNTSKLLKGKLKLNFDTVGTNRYANMFSTVYPFTEKEKQFFQNNVNKTYNQFLTRVADARGFSIERAGQLAKGRVWTGAAAKARNLVDEFGDLDKAIDIAASSAGLNLDDARIKQYPEIKDPFEELLNKLSNNIPEKPVIKISETSIAKQLGIPGSILNQLQYVTQAKGPQMRMMSTPQLD